MNLTPSQIEAIQSPARRLQVVACAGSGKTEVLARRVLKFLSDGLEPSSRVAFTFTEKAAEELEDRIDKRAEEDGFSVRGLPPSSAGLFAGTIHGYCLRLLQSSGEFELYDVLPEEREWALVYRFAKRLGLVSLFGDTCKRVPPRPPRDETRRPRFRVVGWRFVETGRDRGARYRRAPHRTSVLFPSGVPSDRPPHGSPPQWLVRPFLPPARG